MNKKAVRKLRSDLGNLRNNSSNISYRDMVKFAKRCELSLDDRGREPNYTHPDPEFFDLPPVSIPAHTGTIPIGTARNILRSLELYIERFETIYGDD
jgi:hypothetical protein